MTSHRHALESMKTELQHAIESLIELGIIVHDYPDEPTTKLALDMDIQKYIQDVAAVQNTAKTLQDCKLPIDILDYIDAGRNPDIYSREFVELVVKQNQFVRGKMVAMQQFQTALVDELGNAFEDIKQDLNLAKENTSLPPEDGSTNGA